MDILTKSLLNDEGFSRVISAIDGGKCPALLSGIGALPRAHAAAAISLITERPMVCLCSDEQECRKFAADLASFTGKEIRLLTARDFVFYNAESVSRETEHLRLSLFSDLLNGKVEILVATPDALMEKTMPPDIFEALSKELVSGESYDLAGLAELLTSAGYRRTNQVEGSGQFALRGGILDFFSPAYDLPVRCEFFGDDIDSMGLFDISTQRRVEDIQKALILPVQESPVSAAKGGKDALLARLDAYGKRLLKRKSLNPELPKNILSDMERIRDGRILPASDRYLDLIYEEATAASYLPADAVIIMCEPGRLTDRAKNYVWQLSEDITSLIERGILEGNAERFTVPWDNICTELQEFPLIMMASFTTSSLPCSPRTLETLTTKQLPSYGGSLETAVSDISHYIRSGFSVVVLVRDSHRAEILKEYLDSHDVKAGYDFSLSAIPEKGICIIAQGSLSAGLEYPNMRLAVISEGQIMQQLFRKKARKRPKNHQKLDSFTDLSPGDLVVHEQYGIGRFVGMVTREVDKVKKDYIKISYAGTDALYVPATQLDMISKYIGAGEDAPVKLSKLGGTDWTRAKLKAKSTVKDLAEGLIKLQAERMKATGFAFSPDTAWQNEFEDAFEYQETDDQLRAVRDIKKDMENPIPMDRLLCGDVGYGKTEVALRAVMKCVMDGKQAAILVPTTVLAQQHYSTAMRRFSGYPVNIDVLSRFRSPQQLKKALKGIETGDIDIIIGTHKLLNKDIKFKDLGLLVVDEEQRFGVQHKERLKEIARSVDVLTLSATPIPRTLNMALSGVRDMSTIEEPPSDRQPVQTYVIEHDWNTLADAMHRELSRGGQVYYLHNRVDNIERTAIKIREILGDEVSIAVAHGKMDEAALNSVMESMIAGEVQILVCTTIIETGIDIPNVNTLIIEDADRLGLAQLHQIRGRVGRSSRRAYAYFTFRQNAVLGEVAEKRLSAIREFAEFNSGFKIAMRDLEIRGAGNILGAEQSGHMMSVGYDMYLKLLEEAVHEEKGEKIPVKPECSADLSISASIPESYVPSAEQRMDLYRRIAHIRTEEDADDMTDELIDRFGDPPSSVNSLIHIALLRGEAADTGISEIAQREGKLIFTLSDFEMDRISKLYTLPEYKNRIKIEAGTNPAISLKLNSGERVLDAAVKLVRSYKAT